LEKFSLDFIHRHFPDISELEEFYESPKFIVEQILQSEKLKIDSEYQVRLYFAAIYTRPKTALGWNWKIFDNVFYFL